MTSISIMIALWVVLLAWAAVALIRVHMFGKVMDREINRVFEARISGKPFEPYPNISASYKNLKWYSVFNFKFDSLVVYDRTR